MPVQAVKINVGRIRDYKIGSGRTINLLKRSIAIFHLSEGSFRAVHHRCPKGGDLVNSTTVITLFVLTMIAKFIR
ncbi:MAG: hypothetical protein WCF60_01260 [Anaerobacillus sp.]